MALLRLVGHDDLANRFDTLHRDFERLLSSVRPATAQAHLHPGVYPLMNIYDDGTSFLVRAELPGYDPEEIDVTVTGDTLTLSGARHIPAIPEGSHYHRRERRGGRFRRAISLPEQCDSAAVEAKFVDGVLEITLPRSEQAKQRKVAITEG